ncbi:hypothetical protein HYU06_04460 [Candidatus Woesearchaeota archaeon]|nr:hypothetical protein [Candidatus Woesearchaeota archaeon]
MTTTKPIEMFVRLVVPDNIALTAKHTLLKMGFKLADLKRADYYKFEVELNKDNNINKNNTAKNSIQEQLSKVDILANANKHKVSFEKERQGTKILVTELDATGQGLLHTLRERLGLTQVHSVLQGTLWAFTGCSEEDTVKMTKELLINEHYQEFRVLQ